MTQGVINLRELDFNKGDVDHSVARQCRDLIDQSVRYWRDARLLRRNDNDGSYAVVVKLVGDANLGSLLDSPNALFDFAFLDGDDDVRYAANALRKMRAVARTGADSLTLALSDDEMFLCRVERDADTDDMLPWGEFPYGGAVMVGEGSNRVMVGVSGFTQEEDHWLAELVAKFLLLKLNAEDEAAKE